MKSGAFISVYQYLGDRIIYLGPAPRARAPTDFDESNLKEDVIRKPPCRIWQRCHPFQTRTNSETVYNINNNNNLRNIRYGNTVIQVIHRDIVSKAAVSLAQQKGSSSSGNIKRIRISDDQTTDSPTPRLCFWGEWTAFKKKIIRERRLDSRATEVDVSLPTSASALRWGMNKSGRRSFQCGEYVR